MEPNPRLEALGEELEGLAAALSQSPQQLFRSPAKLARLKSLLEEIQSTGRQELDKVVSDSRAQAESAKAMAAEIEAQKPKKPAGAKGTDAPQGPEKSWPPETGGTPLSFWLAKEFAPPREEMEALIVRLFHVLRRPSAAPPQHH